MGLRHRLRRTRPRAGEWSKRQRARARHRGVLQHWRAAVKVHTYGRHSEVRLGREEWIEEGSRSDGDGIWARLCGRNRIRREGFTDTEGAARSGILSRTLAGHRLQ